MSSESVAQAAMPRAPSAKGAGLFDEIEQWSRQRISKRELLAEADSLQGKVFACLYDAYRDDFYAKLTSLKLMNLAIARYHYLNRHSRLVSRPVCLTVDPSNGCQLRCPGCVHSENPRYRQDISWPGGTLKLRTLEDLMRMYGPFSLGAVYYNYGEPLLNPWLPDMLRVSQGYGVSSSLSTNLSLRFDIERFVAASPDYVILSIDGTTQSTYARYRRRGDLGLVLRNVADLVEMKRSMGLSRPYLVWRMLTFEHNLHEVDDAIRMGEELGVNEVLVSTPFDVTDDDPSIRAVTSPREGRHVFSGEVRSSFETVARITRNEAVERSFDESWQDRGNTGDLDEPIGGGQTTCPWLYYNLTIDAARRIMPCCMAPGRDENLVYGSLDSSSADLFNLEQAIVSRQCFADRAKFETEHDLNDPSLPYCTKCSYQPPFTYSPESNAISDLMMLDFNDALGWKRSGHP